MAIGVGICIGIGTCNLGPQGVNCNPSGGEYLYNWTFDCGVDGWGFSPAYPATITDNEDGSLHLKSDSNYGSLVPNEQAYEDADWVLTCKVRNIVGTGKLSLRRPNNTWVNSAPYTTDGEYSLEFSGAIKEIHVGAFNDATYQADYEYISLRKQIPLAQNPDGSQMLNPDGSNTVNPGGYNG
jgi:hypothetical protein